MHKHGAGHFWIRLEREFYGAWIRYISTNPLGLIETLDCHFARRGLNPEHSSGCKNEKLLHITPSDGVQI